MATKSIQTNAKTPSDTVVPQLRQEKKVSNHKNQRNEDPTVGSKYGSCEGAVPWWVKSIVHGGLGLELCSSRFRSLMNRFSIGWTFFLMPPT